MKHLHTMLLSATVIYCLINPSITVAHSIIVLSLCLLYGYKEYLNKLEQPDYKKEIEDLKDKVSKSASKEELLDSVNKLNDEMGKISMSTIKQQAPSKDNKKTLVF